MENPYRHAIRQLPNGHHDYAMLEVLGVRIRPSGSIPSALSDGGRWMRPMTPTGLVRTMKSRMATDMPNSM